jgi:hypothetical protein
VKGGIFGVVTLVFLGAIAADVLSHPQGTAAAGNSLSALLKTSLQAVTGQVVGGSGTVARGG